MMKLAKPSLWRIIRPTSICLGSFSPTASRWPWQPGATLFVIDRAVNAMALACAFDAQGLGLLCMLDDNEHAGLESFEATLVDTLEDGTKVYSGPWKERRPDDPRHFAIVAPTEGKTLVYWGTPQVAGGLGDDRMATGVPRAQRDSGTQLQAHERPWRAQDQLWP